MKQEKPLFQNDLSAEEEQKRAEQAEKDAAEKKGNPVLDIVEGVATIISNITG